MTFPLVIIVNGEPATVQISVGMALSEVARIALAHVGSVGRPLEHWYFRDDDGIEIGMDFVIAKPFEPGAKLWLYLDYGMVDAGLDAEGIVALVEAGFDKEKVLAALSKMTEHGPKEPRG